MTKIISNSMYGDKFCATIISMDSDGFVVSNEYASFRAKKAVSCLVEPKISDEVLLYKADEESIYITDILARHESVAIEIIAKDGISVKAQNITLNANESINSFADEANMLSQR